MAPRLRFGAIFLALALLFQAFGLQALAFTRQFLLALPKTHALLLGLLQFGVQAVEKPCDVLSV